MLINVLLGSGHVNWVMCNGRSHIPNARKILLILVSLLSFAFVILPIFSSVLSRFKTQLHRLHDGSCQGSYNKRLTPPPFRRPQCRGPR